LKSMELSSVLGKCTVIIGEFLENWIKKQSRKNHVFITDTNIFRLYGKFFTETPTIVLGTGEQEKNLNTIQRIYQQLMEFEADRTTVITGIGGGMVCDITGFAASTYMRGLRFNLVPTSLLAQVDASIGGKNGVNLRKYKNIIGTFTQPEHVLLDFNLLKTLSQREVTSGAAEIVKHALVGSNSFFSYLEKNSSGLCLLEPDVVEMAVMESIRIKSEIVRADATEKDQRRILNFGHTFGHAFRKNIRDYSRGGCQLGNSRRFKHLRVYGFIKQKRKKQNPCPAQEAQSAHQYSQGKIGDSRHNKEG